MKKIVLAVLVLLLNAATARSAEPYLEEVKALGIVSGQGLACGASKFDTFEMLARAILITKASSDRQQAEGMRVYNEAKADAYISKQMDGFFECAQINRRFGMERNTLGFSVLTNGISQMPAMIGLFVVAQAFAEMDTLSERFIIAASRLTDRFMSLTELRASLPNFIRSGLIGTAIGILPGIGGTLASVVAYDQQKRVAKHPENYGRGELQGIIASETANNATIGGAPG